MPFFVCASSSLFANSSAGCLLTRDDLQLFHTWLHLAHVTAWWGPQGSLKGFSSLGTVQTPDGTALLMIADRASLAASAAAASATAPMP